MAFAATSRPEESLIFYRGVLGLRLLDDTEFATVYDANGTTLRMQKVGTVTAVPYTVLGWLVRDIEHVSRNFEAMACRWSDTMAFRRMN